MAYSLLNRCINNVEVNMKLISSILMCVVLVMSLGLSSTSFADDTLVIGRISFPVESGLVITYPAKLGKPFVLDTGDNLTVEIPGSNGLTVIIPEERPFILYRGDNIVVTFPNRPGSGGLRIAFPRNVRPAFPVGNRYPTITFPTNAGGGTIKYYNSRLQPIGGRN
jgi:hypothetical protein